MKISIENLPSGMTEQELQGLFAQIGEVDFVEIMKGILSMRAPEQGYVEMPLEVDTYRAVHCLNGVVLKGKSIHVAEVNTLTAQMKSVVLHGINTVRQLLSHMTDHAAV